MLAALTVAGLPVRPASATKNVLAATMNASAVAIFLFSRDVHWPQAAVLGVGAICGGLIGTALLTRVNERALRIGGDRARRGAERRPVPRAGTERVVARG